MFNGYINYKWQVLIAMLIYPLIYYQKVYLFMRILTEHVRISQRSLEQWLQNPQHRPFKSWLVENGIPLMDCEYKLPPKVCWLV